MVQRKISVRASYITIRKARRPAPDGDLRGSEAQPCAAMRLLRSGMGV
jgi:hypothetical protein